MLNQDLKKAIEQAIEDEEHDIEKYNSMVEEAEACQYHKIAKVLKDIACEEETHARHLSHLLNIE